MLEHKPKHLSRAALQAEDTEARNLVSTPQSPGQRPQGQRRPHEAPLNAATTTTPGGTPPRGSRPPSAFPVLAAGPAHLDLHEGASVEAAGGRRQGAPQAAALRHGAAP